MRHKWIHVSLPYHPIIPAADTCRPPRASFAPVLCLCKGSRPGTLRWWTPETGHPRSRQPLQLRGLSPPGAPPCSGGTQTPGPWTCTGQPSSRAQLRAGHDLLHCRRLAVLGATPPAAKPMGLLLPSRPAFSARVIRKNVFAPARRAESRSAISTAVLYSARIVLVALSSMRSLPARRGHFLKVVPLRRGPRQRSSPGWRAAPVGRGRSRPPAGRAPVPRRGWSPPRRTGRPPPALPHPEFREQLRDQAGPEAVPARTAVDGEPVEAVGGHPEAPPGPLDKRDPGRGLRGGHDLHHGRRGLARWAWRGQLSPSGRP